MDKTFFCIDNFYKDPDQIRQDVLSGNGFTWFPHNTSYSYPNGNAPFLGKMTKERYVPNRRLDLVVSGFAGENVAPMMRLDHGCFRLAKPEDSTSMFSHNIHADSMTIKKNDWAGVLYLTPVKEEIEGTIFYKNTVLNKSFFTEKTDYDTIQSLGTDNPEQWQKELVSYFIYNRLIIYRADLFHAPGPAFGNDDESGRLIQVFFWKEL